MKNTLSVYMVVRDEEEVIEGALKSVSWADEIIIALDDRTVDGTVEIAKKYTNKIYPVKFITFSQMLRFGLGKTTSIWALWIDPDERITPALKKEILRKINSGKFNGYHAYFREVVFGKEFVHSNNRVQGAVRLVRKGKAKFTKKLIHDRLIVDGEVGTLNNEILHYSKRTIFQTMNKFNQFSSLEAQELYGYGTRTNLLTMFLAPLNTFIRTFFIDRNYQNGMHGFIYSVLMANYYMLKHFKIWELMQKEKTVNKK